MPYVNEFTRSSALKVERETEWVLEPNKHVYKVTVPVAMSKIVPNDDVYKTHGSKLFLHTEFEFKIIANSNASVVEIESQAKQALKSMLATDIIFNL
ncbi:hypothetical protein MTZ49_12270 [Entomomonas sp. E2T0]|uniref:hypothetical protein n=1 Tax=Entomomonas sp. E2T0 TaxID=2930213 RepID=UPI00222815C8|nr:hypothetical protein [Entomomonas sp. E2T0]UYZ83365.1 hypothetical protein MTZ49_12270 [Entomomonas sp. E2T0]